MAEKKLSFYQRAHKIASENFNDAQGKPMIQLPVNLCDTNWERSMQHEYKSELKSKEMEI